jgi:hypothetical protein
MHTFITTFAFYNTLSMIFGNLYVKGEESAYTHPFLKHHKKNTKII